MWNRKNKGNSKLKICYRKFRVLFFLSLLILLSACKSSKSFVTSDGVATKKANEKLVSDILNAETNYKTISGKVALELIPVNKTSGMKLNSQLKIVRNEVIQLSMRAPFINTEVFRLDISPDSISVIDRLGKRFAVESIKDIESSKNIQFNYQNLQALFTNALFFPGKEQVLNSDFNQFLISLNSGKYNLIAKDRQGMSYDFTVDSSDRIISTKITGLKTYSLDWKYSNFIQDVGSVYPTKMDISVNAGKTKFTFVISYSSLDIDKDLKVDRNLPSNYKRVSVIEIIKSYIK